VLVDPSDPADIARGLLRAVESPESWEKLHQAGIERVISKYTWERTAEGYLKVIKAIVEEGRRAGEIEIPPYFRDPAPVKYEIPVDALASIYF